MYVLQFTSSSLTGKDHLKKAEEEDLSRQSKKRPRPMLLPHMTPLPNTHTQLMFI